MEILFKEMRSLLLLIIPTALFSYPGSSCHTPIGEPGRCVPTQQCQFILDLQRIYRTKLPPAVRNQIRQLICYGGPRSNFHLCCPLKSVINENTHLTVSESPKSQNLNYINPVGIDLLNSFTECGMSRAGAFVSGGKPTKFGEFPWMVLLKYDTYGYPFLCGGSLITDRFVLTAAHCTTHTSKLISVRLGEYTVDDRLYCLNNSQPCEPNYIEHAVHDIRPHPLYKKGAISYDIALIKLAQPVKFQSNIQPLCLPIEKSLQTISSDERFSIAGWGLTEENVPSPMLLQAMVERQDLNVCRNYFLDAPVTSNHICAVGNGKQHTCQGDSGGPLFSLKLSEKLNMFRYVQIGIISFGGRFCGVNEDQPGIFASVIDMLPWITQNLY